MSDIHSVKSLAELEPAFTEAGLRWLIFTNEAILIAKGAIFKVGSKVMIDRDLFHEALKSGDLKNEQKKRG